MRLKSVSGIVSASQTFDIKYLFLYIKHQVKQDFRLFSIGFLGLCRVLRAIEVTLHSFLGHIFSIEKRISHIGYFQA